MPRAKIQVTEKQVAEMAKFGASISEIAEVFACDESTIRKRFSGILVSARGQMKIRLRRLQWKSAEKGSIPMQIHLGKHMLGQTEISLRGPTYSEEEWESFTKEQLDKIIAGENPYPAPVPSMQSIIDTMSPEERKRRLKKIRAVLNAAPEALDPSTNS